MADAEVKLNFTADAERAKAELNAMRVMLDELSAAFKRVSDYFSDGSTPPGGDHLELLEMMTAEVERLRAAYESLQEQFANSQKANAEMSAGYLAQISELRKAMQDALDKVRELNNVIDEQNSKIDGQNERIKELEKRLKEMPRSGISSFRSLRSIVGNFIVQLFKGKVAVSELGVALKGLAYSTVVLGAIQLAMEGITWAWKGIKSLFTESKEEMKAAEEAAKRAQDELDKAKTEAQQAADEVRKLKDRLAEKEAAEALRETLAGITREYEAQRAAVEGTLSAIREAAQAKARERAAEAAAKTGEMDMELLGLEERFVAGDIDKRNYVIQKAEIEKRKRDEARVAAVDTAEIERDAAAARAVAAKAELKDAEVRVEAARKEAGKYATDDDVKLAEEQYTAHHKKVVSLRAKADKMEMEFLDKYFNKDMTLKRSPFTLKGAVALENLEKYEKERLAFEGAKKIADEEGAKQPVMQRELAELRKSAAQGKEASTRLNEERKTAEKLEKDADAAVKEEQKANAALTETLARTAREGGLDDRMTDKRIGIELAKIANDEKGKADKAAAGAEKGRLRGRVSELLQDARAAAGTKKDKDDDAAALKAISDFIRDQGDEIEKYGVNVRSLIDVCRKLSNGSDRVKARVDSLADEIRQLQRTVDKRTARP